MPARYRRPRLSPCLTGVLLAGISFASLSAPGMPSAEAIEAARQQMRAVMPRVAPMMEQARQDNPMPKARDLARQPISAMPNVTVSRQPIDVGAIAERYREMTRPQQAQQGIDVLVFVSLSMPRETLRLLADQTSRAGGALVLRGLKKDSMMVTLKEVQEILDGQDVSWQIDPEAFRRFGIIHAPSFVVARQTEGCQGDCAKMAMPADSFVKVAGDVSLDYALDAIGRGAGDWRDEVNARLVRMRAR